MNPFENIIQYIDQEYHQSSIKEDFKKFDQNLYFEKLSLLSEEYNLDTPQMLIDDEGIFENLFIIKTPDSMNFKEKKQIWKKIVDTMHDYAENTGIISCFNNNSIILE